MGYNPKRPNLQKVHRDIIGLVRAFPATSVVIERVTYTFDPLEGQVKAFLPIYKGEALVKPISSTVQRIDMGQISTFQKVILVPGKRDIREEDFAHITENGEEMLYVVKKSGDLFGAYVIVALDKYQQQP